MDTPNTKPRKNASPVWEYFILNEEGNKATCFVGNICEAQFSVINGSTTILLGHLEKRHSMYLQKKNKDIECDVDTAKSDLPKKKDSTIDDTKLFSNSIKTRQAKINTALTNFIAMDDQAFTVVEDVGFRVLWEDLDIKNVTLPHRSTISKNYLPDRAEKFEIDLKNLLKSTNHIVITSDGWSSPNSDAFITICAHYFNNQNSRNVVMLGMVYVSPETTKLEMGFS